MTPKQSLRHLARQAEAAAGLTHNVALFRSALAQAPDLLAVVRVRLGELERVQRGETVGAVRGAVALYDAVAAAHAAVAALAANCPGLHVLDAALPGGERLSNGQEVH